jgi:hypothetical protein
MSNSNLEKILKDYKKEYLEKGFHARFPDIPEGEYDVYKAFSSTMKYGNRYKKPVTDLDHVSFAPSTEDAHGWKKAMSGGGGDEYDSLFKLRLKIKGDSAFGSIEDLFGPLLNEIKVEGKDLEILGAEQLSGPKGYVPEFLKGFFEKTSAADKLKVMAESSLGKLGKGVKSLIAGSLLAASVLGGSGVADAAIGKYVGLYGTGNRYIHTAGQVTCSDITGMTVKDAGIGSFLTGKNAEQQRQILKSKGYLNRDFSENASSVFTEASAGDIIFNTPSKYYQNKYPGEKVGQSAHTAVVAGWDETGRMHTLSGNAISAADYYGSLDAAKEHLPKNIDKRIINPKDTLNQIDVSALEGISFKPEVNYATARLPGDSMVKNLGDSVTDKTVTYDINGKKITLYRNLRDVPVSPSVGQAFDVASVPKPEVKTAAISASHMSESGSLLSTPMIPLAGRRRKKGSNSVTDVALEVADSPLEVKTKPLNQVSHTSNLVKSEGQAFDSASRSRRTHAPERVTKAHSDTQKILKRLQGQQTRGVNPSDTWFHGTNKVFDEFSASTVRKGNVATNANVMFFTKSSNFANQYAEITEERPLDLLFAEGSQPNIRPVNISTSNTWDHRNKKHQKLIKDRIGRNATPEQMKMTDMMLDHGSWRWIEPEFEHIQSLGFDSIRFTEGGTENLAVFNPKSVKSIWDTGTKTKRVNVHRQNGKPTHRRTRPVQETPVSFNIPKITQQKERGKSSKNKYVKPEVKTEPVTVEPITSEVIFDTTRQQTPHPDGSASSHQPNMDTTAPAIHVAEAPKTVTVEPVSPTRPVSAPIVEKPVSTAPVNPVGGSRSPVKEDSETARKLAAQETAAENTKAASNLLKSEGQGVRSGTGNKSFLAGAAIGAAAGGAVVATHNAFSRDDNKWGYGKASTVGAIAGGAYEALYLSAKVSGSRGIKGAAARVAASLVA